MIDDLFKPFTEVELNAVRAAVAARPEEGLPPVPTFARLLATLDEAIGRVVALEEAIGVMVPLCLRNYYARCDEVDKERVGNVLVRLERAMHPNADPVHCEWCAKMLRHPGEGYECLVHLSPIARRHAAEFRKLQGSPEQCHPLHRVEDQKT